MYAKSCQKVALYESARVVYTAAVLKKTPYGTRFYLHFHFAIIAITYTLLVTITN